MDTKKMVFIGLTVGGTVGGYTGSLLDHTGIGLWSILLSTIGGIAGIWVGYKLGDM